MFNDPSTTEIYTLSLHDALPIWHGAQDVDQLACADGRREVAAVAIEIGRGADLDFQVAGRQLHLPSGFADQRSEEHTSELQSQSNLVCRLLLEKKKNDRVQPRHR